MSTPTRTTTIFLCDSKQPQYIYLLKRAPTKTFAPNLYTGVGGKIEGKEAPLENAYRELEEETGLKNIALTEFGRLIVVSYWTVYQFFGLYNGPVPKCPEGTIEKFKISNIINLPLIPTQEIFCQEWKNRNWQTNKPFTIFIEREKMEDLYSKITKQEIKEGLLENS
jgi:8-oxo-dGTP pyrophosphatase MutT (NUDIX family)